MEIFLDCLDIVDFVIEKIEVQPDLMKDPLYAQAFSVELIKEKVDQGIPFREAYLLVKKQMEEEPGKIPDIHHTHEGSIGQLNTREIRSKLKRIQEQYGEVDFNSIYDRLLDFEV